MSVVETAPSQLSTFGNLPPEIMSKIFGYLNSKKMPNYRLVDKFWDFSIQNFCQVIIAINQNENWTDRVKTNAQNIHLQLFALNTPFLEILTENNLTNRIHSLTFGRILFSWNVIPILQACTNLHTLEFSLMENFQNQNPRDFEIMEIQLNSNQNPSKILPSLKILKISFGSPSSKAVDFEQDLRRIRFLRALFPLFSLENGSSKLIRVQVVIWSTKESLKKNIELCNYTGADNQVKNVNIFASFCKDLSQKTKDFESIFALIKASSENEKECLGNYIGLTENGAWVTEFRHRNKYGWHDPENQNLWMEFLKTERLKLKRFSLDEHIFLIWPQILNILNKHAATLKEIELVERTEDENLEFDFAVNLPEMKNLEKLTIRRKYPSSGVENINVFPEINNLHNLSSTIRVLNICLTIRLENESDFSQETFQNLKNLEIFEFSARPWFTFANEKKIWALNASHVQNMIEWLPRLKNFNLRNRMKLFETSNPRIKIQSYTLPMSSLNWIVTDSRPGIFYKKVPNAMNPLRTNPRPKPEDFDYSINIKIESEFRNNAQI